MAETPDYVVEVPRGSDPGGLGSAMQLSADPGWGAWPAAGGASQDAEQRADGQSGADLQPGVEQPGTSDFAADLDAESVRRALPEADPERPISTAPSHTSIAC